MAQELPPHIRDFISFMKHEEREHLIALPATWYYLNACDNHTVEVYRVDPEQSFMGNATRPAQLALIDDPIVGSGRVITG